MVRTRGTASLQTPWTLARARKILRGNTKAGPSSTGCSEPWSKRLRQLCGPPLKQERATRRNTPKGQRRTRCNGYSGRAFARSDHDALECSACPALIEQFCIAKNSCYRLRSRRTLVLMDRSIACRRIPTCLRVGRPQLRPWFLLSYSCRHRLARCASSRVFCHHGSSWCL